MNPGRQVPAGIFFALAVAFILARGARMENQSGIDF
jgi:hypothetical protein